METAAQILHLGKCSESEGDICAIGGKGIVAAAMDAASATRLLVQSSAESVVAVTEDEARYTCLSPHRIDAGEFVDKSLRKP